MIQRQQTLWLILAVVASFLTYKFPFYTGTLLENNVPTYSELDGGSTLFLLLLTGLSVLIGAIAIFMYKDRKTQFRLAVGGILLSVIILVIYIIRMKAFSSGTISLTSLLAIAILAGYIFAARGIRKDEKLLKSLDKLR